jgi:hypothetical protein
MYDRSNGRGGIQMTDKYKFQWQIVYVHYTGHEMKYRVVNYSDKSTVIFEKMFDEEEDAKAFLRKMRDESI